jgi:hypothetical protein
MHVGWDCEWGTGNHQCDGILAGSVLKYVEDIPHNLSSAELQKMAILGAAHLLNGRG